MGYLSQPRNYDWRNSGERPGLWSQTGWGWRFAQMTHPHTGDNRIDILGVKSQLDLSL
jgi:hypothetical protein